MIRCRESRQKYQIVSNCGVSPANPKYTTSDASCKKLIHSEWISTNHLIHTISIFASKTPPNGKNVIIPNPTNKTSLEKHLICPIYRQFSIKHLIPRWRCFDLQQAWSHPKFSCKLAPQKKETERLNQISCFFSFISRVACIFGLDTWQLRS